MFDLLNAGCGWEKRRKPSRRAKTFGSLDKEQPVAEKSAKLLHTHTRAHTRVQLPSVTETFPVVPVSANLRLTALIISQSAQIWRIKVVPPSNLGAVPHAEMKRTKA